MKTDNKTLVAALRILVEEIDSPDGIPNAAIAEAANRIEELEDQIFQIHKDYGCEIRDPCGTIWEYAKELQTAIEKLPMLWNQGYKTFEEDGRWYLFRKDGEGILDGEDFHDLCVRIAHKFKE